MVKDILKLIGYLLMTVFSVAMVIGSITHSPSSLWWAIPISLAVISASTIYVVKRKSPSTSRSNAQESRRRPPHEDCSQ
ncbi:hypothetical protein [Bifidobacterium cuniculi]|uniref:Uncharacterized protein n=1 Tax=Bifidobacterium cuniculi TaxID=1688 RepID=A0A087ATB2_9BIFI|nr:hypothetical protein [Bifidobacterium cuniculi]KFI62012.1 hypothetical protein BCUN_1724 [Bifidobacterium cuniculi]